MASLETWSFDRAFLVGIPQIRGQIARCYALSQAQKLGNTVVNKQESAAGASRFSTPIISTDCLPITKPRGEGPCAHPNSVQHLSASVGNSEGHSTTQILPVSCLC